jgi:fumarate hydratase, class I
VTATPFEYTEVLPVATETDTEYRLVSEEGVRVVEVAGRTFLEVDPEALTALATNALTDNKHQQH